MRRTQPSIAMSRGPAYHHGCFHGSVFMIASVVLVGVKAAAIRFSNCRIYLHHHLRLLGCTDVDAWGADAPSCVRIPGCRQHQHIFTFNRDAFDSKAGSGMCLPSRTATLQDADAERYIGLHEHGYARVLNLEKCSAGSTG